MPHYLHHDQDSIYARAFRKTTSVLGITEVIGERHLVGVLRRYAIYYNESRRHLALDRSSPSPRSVENGCGDVVAIPHLGGLHHRYTRAA